MSYWLVKTEPSTFSFEDFFKTPQHETSWEGIRNYQARNFLRDQFKKGDQVLIYHSNTEEPAVMGIATVVKEAYPDKFALDPKSKYFDEKAKQTGKNNWVMVDLKATHRLQTPVSRNQMSQHPLLKNHLLLKRGTRLSVLPFTEKEFEAVVALGQPKLI